MNSPTRLHVLVVYCDWRKLTDEQRFGVMSDGDFNPNAAYECIWTGDVAALDAADACEQMFEKFNIGDRGGERVRSLSVGDIVMADRAAYLCKPAGWEKICIKHDDCGESKSLSEACANVGEGA